MPPTKYPAVPEKVTPVPAVSDVVATFAKVLTPEKYGMLPWTAAVLVESPPKESVSSVRITGQVTARLVSALMSRPLTSSVPTPSQVAAPRAERERTNWFEQAPEPVYSATRPSEPVSARALVMPVKYVLPETVSWVEEAYVAKVEEAMREKGEVALSQRPVEVAFTPVPL